MTDLAKLAKDNSIIESLEKHFDNYASLNVELNNIIHDDDLYYIFVTSCDNKFKISYNDKLDGQFRKDGSNKRLIELIGNFEFKKFKDGVKETYKWYENEMER